MNLKIFAPYAYFSPERAASSYLWDNLHEDLAKAGIECYMYVPTPTRGVSDDIRKIYKTEKRSESLYNGLFHIIRFNLYKEGKNPISRAFRYFLQGFIHFLIGVFGKKSRSCNIIFTGSTPPFQGALVGLIKIITKQKVVYTLQDIFPDSLVNNGLAKKGGGLWKIGRVIENFTYRNADKIIVISEDFKKNIMAKGVPEEKIVVVYNWVDQHAVVDIPREKNKLFDAYGLDRSKFYVTYNGNIGLSQNMDMLLSVAEEFQMEYADIQFVLVGSGAYLNEVKRMVAEKELDNVHLLPFQPYEDISHVFSLGDASLVISKPGTGAASVPSKTWSIMSASRPVLANFDENELKQIVEEHNCGIFTKAGDKEAFKQSILALYNDREKAVDIGRNGRQFVLDNLTREVGTQKYVDVIKSVVG
ncbi:glycosyltransferase family 4 protein [Parabacteroides distasonis]|nr:glycosyltransferase family 4 protein [Parabacteroides distasonis]